MHGAGRGKSTPIFIIIINVIKYTNQGILCGIFRFATSFFHHIEQCLARFPSRRSEPSQSAGRTCAHPVEVIFQGSYQFGDDFPRLRVGLEHAQQKGRALAHGLSDRERTIV